MEIERKFVVEAVRKEPELPSGVRLRQGYLATAPVEVRLRASGETAYVLTVKGEGGLARVEVEVPLSRSDFDELWPLTAQRRVEKTRHRLVENGHTVELDVYHGAHAGLVVAEVEFEDIAAATRFKPPMWFGREVTGDRRFKNAELALASIPPTL